MRGIATIVFILGIGSSGWSQNPTVANFALRDAQEGWIIEMDFSRAAIDAELSEQLSEDKFATLDRQAYQRLLIDYVRERLRLTEEGEVLSLGTEGIRLDPQRSYLQFLIPDLEYPKSLVVEIPLFQGVENQTNVFRAFRGDQQLFDVALTRDNDFQARLDFDSGRVELSYANLPSTSNRFFGLGFGFVAFLVLSLVMSHKSLAQKDI